MVLFAILSVSLFLATFSTVAGEEKESKEAINVIRIPQIPIRRSVVPTFNVLNYGDKIVFSVDMPVNAIELTINNLEGQVVKSMNCCALAGVTYVVDITSLPAGSYVICFLMPGYQGLLYQGSFKL